VQVSTNENFTGKVIIGQVTDVQKQLTGLGAGGTYYWRVEAVAKGVTSPWSEVWNFTTASADTGSTGSSGSGGSTGGGSSTGSGGSGGSGSGGSGTVTFE
jgi:hypothetical protein